MQWAGTAKFNPNPVTTIVNPPFLPSPFPLSHPYDSCTSAALSSHLLRVSAHGQALERIIQAGPLELEVAQQLRALGSLHLRHARCPRLLWLGKTFAWPPLCLATNLKLLSRTRVDAGSHGRQLLRLLW
jgi:hypothetical protein